MTTDQQAPMLQTMLLDQGASFVGFSSVAPYLPPELRPLPFAITIGVRLSDFVLDQCHNGPTCAYYHHYKTVNILIDQLALKAVLWLQQRGQQALPVAASQTVRTAQDRYRALFPHKTAAVQAGLGRIGRSALFIHQAYGPRVRLGTVLTDLALPLAEELHLGDCGECHTCVDACPAGAISGGAWQPDQPRDVIFNAKACSDYMKNHCRVTGRGDVCGICVVVCQNRPHRGHARRSNQ